MQQISNSLFSNNKILTRNVDLRSFFASESSEKKIANQCYKKSLQVNNQLIECKQNKILFIFYHIFRLSWLDSL